MDTFNHNPLFFVSFFILFLSFSVATIIVFMARKKRKDTVALLDKVEEIKRFESELTNTKLEIQEQTLKNLSWELHDNIGQMLSVVKMQLNVLAKGLQEKDKYKVAEVSKILSKALKDVRLLSKTLNYEVLDRMSLEDAIRIELERFNRLELFYAKLEVSGEPFQMERKKTTVIFRIFQEIFSNVVKHAQAENLLVRISYQDNVLNMEAIDDGIGFDLSKIQSGCGLLNMKSRATMIGANLNIKSTAGHGSIAQLNYKKKL